MMLRRIRIHSSSMCWAGVLESPAALCLKSASIFVVPAAMASDCASSVVIISLAANKL